MRSRLSLAAIGITALIMSCPPAIASSLEQQLDIRPYNATEGPSRDIADQWMQLGNEQFAGGDYPQAIASWQEAADIYQLLGDTQAAGLAYSTIGSTYGMLGNYPQAEQAMRLRIGTARDSGDLPGTSYGLNNLGTLYLNRGQIEPAQVFFEEALQLAQAADDNRAIGLSLSNLGLVAIQKGDLSVAAELLEAATNYRYLAGDYQGEANSSNSLGDVYVDLGRDSNAIGAYRIGLRKGAEASDRALQLRALDGLLGIYFEREAWQTVRTYLDRRIELTLGEVEPDSQTAVTLRWIGDYYFAQGEFITAKESYTKGLGLARAFENTTLEVELTNRILGL